jgi:hypothetical protein
LVGYRALVIAVVALHYAFLGYVVVGGFLALAWRWTIWAHIAACAWGVAIVAVPTLQCPLTAAEVWARHRAGMPVYGGGFIDHYVINVLYPAGWTTLVQVLCGLVVAASWVTVHRIRRNRTAEVSG